MTTSLSEDVSGETVVLTIDPSLQALCPPLSEDEAQQLEANLLADGCRDALIAWPCDGTLVLIDGHNRYALCTQHALPYTVHLQEFASRDDVIQWMVALQLGRRNLTAEQKSYLRGTRYNLEKKREGAPDGNQNAAKQRTHSDSVALPTRERLADEYHVAPKTIA